MVFSYLNRANENIKNAVCKYTFKIFPIVFYFALLIIYGKVHLFQTVLQL